jgi:hypothetical protein
VMTVCPKFTLPSGLGSWDVIRARHVPLWLTPRPSAIACVTKRGGIFKANVSSTWSSIGSYALNFQPVLGVTGSADYGLDTISIGDATSVPEQIVGVMNSTEFLLGSLGLGVIPSNFSSKNQPTFLSSMVENQSAIPSHSYGYTAGAYYREYFLPCAAED